MKKLTIDSFISAINDNELSQYYILGSLKNYYSQLNKTRLYPALSELFDLGKILEEIVNKKSQLEKIFPQKSNNTAIAPKVDTPEKDIFFESDIEKVFDFINWAYPKINEAIAEGKAIYSFVKQNMKIEEIGIIPLYKNEGYFIITDNRSKTVNIFRYEVPFISLDKNSSSSMKISLIKKFSTSEITNSTSAQIKIELIKEFTDLPNPATFNFEFDIDFPFEETMLPIAKRRLIKKLAA